MSIPRINEKSAGFLQFSCYDKDRAAETPTTLSYRVDCLTTGVEIRADTSITPAVQSGEIALTPDDTTLQSQDNVTELRLVTVVANEGLDTQYIERYRYEVVNLTAVT